MKNEKEDKRSNDDEFFLTKRNFVKKNKFFLMGEVDDSFPQEIIAPFIEAVEKRVGKTDPSPIEMYITSFGGELTYCWDLITWMEYAKSKGIPVHTYVTSVAFSAGSLIAVCGSKRFASRRAYHGLHFARGWDYSHNPEMGKRNQDTFNFLQDELVKIYKTNTKLKNIEDKLLADNYCVKGEDLLKYGLIDKFI